MSLAILMLAATLSGQPASHASRPKVMRQVAQGSRRPPPPEAVVGDAASLPITFTAGVPTLEVTINGRGPFKLGFDTGAPGGPHLAAKVVEQLKLQPIGEVMMSDPSGRNGMVMKLYPLDSVAFGGVSAKGWVGSAQPVLPGKLDSLDGAVGLDAFAGYIVTIDYPHARFSLERGGLPPANGKTVFSYREGGAPSVPLTIEGRTIAADIDTGNTASAVIVPAAFASGLKHIGEARAAGVAHTVSNSIQMFTFPVGGAVRVGSTVLAVSSIGYPGILPIANIGSLALANTILKVDSANGRVSITPVE